MTLKYNRKFWELLGWALNNRVELTNVLKGDPHLQPKLGINDQKRNGDWVRLGSFPSWPGPGPSVTTWVDSTCD